MPNDLLPGPARKLNPSVGEVDALRPFGLYVHFPFCGLRCPYCDFAIDVRKEIPHQRYADAVCAEIAARAPWFSAAQTGNQNNPSALVSVYFGGGTPGLWRPACVEQVISTACHAFGVPAASRPGLEVTLEANPGEVSLPHLRALRDVGINRLSFGVQTFDDGLLTKLGRSHNQREALNAIPLAREAGISNISCDLMFGLPGQTEAQWRHSLEILIDQQPEHVSCYALTVEPFTPFGQLERKGQLDRPDEDAVAAWFTIGEDLLGAAGYQHYEVSSYARRGGRARHNSLYWTQGSYLGVGCAAASFRPLASGGAWRFVNPRATETYLKAAEAGGGHVAPSQVEWRAPEELEREALWLGLRTLDGVDRILHRRLFGRDPLDGAGRAQAAERLVAAGWLIVHPDRLSPTLAGLGFADELATRLWD